MVASAAVQEAGDNILAGLTIIRPETHGRYSLSELAVRKFRAQLRRAGRLAAGLAASPSITEHLRLSQAEVLAWYYDPTLRRRPVQPPPAGGGRLAYVVPPGGTRRGEDVRRQRRRHRGGDGGPRGPHPHRRPHRLGDPQDAVGGAQWHPLARPALVPPGAPAQQAHARLPQRSQGLLRPGAEPRQAARLQRLARLGG